MKLNKKLDYIFSSSDLVTKKVKSLIAQKIDYKSRLKLKAIEQIKDLYQYLYS